MIIPASSLGGRRLVFVIELIDCYFCSVRTIARYRLRWTDTKIDWLIDKLVESYRDTQINLFIKRYADRINKIILCPRLKSKIY